VQVFWKKEKKQAMKREAAEQASPAVEPGAAVAVERKAFSIFCVL
jgi:hypothetical protein